MLAQSILDRGDSVSPSTAETEGRGSGLGLRWERPRPPERRDRPGAKEVSARGAMRPRPRRSRPEVPGGRDRPRREVGLMGGGEEREGSGTRARGYLLGSAVFMFWPSFTFFRSTVPSPSFSLSHPPTPVLLSRADRGSFLALRCCSLLGPR